MGSWPPIGSPTRGSRFSCSTPRASRAGPSRRRSSSSPATGTTSSRRSIRSAPPPPHAPLALAHPGAGGSCAVISRDLDETLASLGPDAAAWLDLWNLWQRVGPALVEGIATPLPALRLARRVLPALPLLASSVRRVAERFRGDAAKRLFAGNAMHADLHAGSSLGGLYGFLLAMLGHEVGWPC